MKRRLTPEEEKYTRRGVKNMEKEMIDHMESLKVTQATITFMEQKQLYDDLVRPYNRAKQLKEMEKQSRYFEEKIKEVERTISIDKKSLRDGVNVKENTQVG